MAELTKRGSESPKKLPAAQVGARVLIVDDGGDTAGALALSLTNDGYVCTVAADGPAAIRAIAAQTFDLVISKVQVAGLSGMELLDELTKSHPKLPVIIITAASGPTGTEVARRHGAFDYLAKPYEVLALDALIREAVGETPEATLALVSAQRPFRVELLRGPSLTDAWPKLLGSDSMMSDLRDRIARIAASSAPALIQGESGSGKDLVAHAIHSEGPRRDAPFIAVNTSAIPEQLLESEMFGHVRGAFTGASDARRGHFLAANGGTLFLDEIGDMPLGLQAKLLRVIELGELRAVGSDTTRRLDVRVIAATHRNLPKMVEEGKFREDLYFRLNVLPIVVPPLRDRRGDIPELALRFLEQARVRMPTSPVRKISGEAIEALTLAAWPGNVRELASTVERLVVFGREETISLAHLSLISLPGAAAVATVQPGLVIELCTLQVLTQRHVAYVLTHTEGNKTRAAEILGINLSTLYRWQKPETGTL